MIAMHSSIDLSSSTHRTLRCMISPTSVCGDARPILETYREKARECVRAADEVRNLSKRVEPLGLASVYMALADYEGTSRARAGPLPVGAAQPPFWDATAMGDTGWDW